KDDGSAHQLRFFKVVGNGDALFHQALVTRSARITINPKGARAGPRLALAHKGSYQADKVNSESVGNGSWK
ncbi:MAG: hypothetical protein ABJG56_10910, partial [Lentilitoribacter sp.]